MAGTRAKPKQGSWTLLDLLDQAPGLAVLSSTLSELVDEGAPVVALTGDLKYSNGLVRFADRHPDRFWNMGIAEQNMVTVAAGMASTGVMPFVADFASFLALLCCEQIRTDIAYTKLPVRLIGHHAGITLGFYGTSHHATEDLAIMRSLAGLTVVAPTDARMLSAALRASVKHEQPIYMRIGRGREPDVYADGDLDRFQFGQGIWHRKGTDANIIATGSMVFPALRAIETLDASGLDVGLLDMHTVKPLDEDAVFEAARLSPTVITVEEHNVIGGLGGAVAEALSSRGVAARLRRHGIEDAFILIGAPNALYAHYRLNADGIAAVVREEVER